VHLAWDTFAPAGGFVTEAAFEGALSFDPTNQRYNLVDVHVLPQFSPWTIQGSQLTFTPKTMIGELRGWTSDGQSVLGIQDDRSDSVDAWATSLATGQSQPLTDHAEYTDPNFMSPDGKWLISEEVAGSGRLDFISGMEGIPPITDLLSTGWVSQMRNNLNRRFFLPWLVNPARAQSEQINAGGDPNWNAAADPVWLADSAGVVWAENLACGANPTPHQCAQSSEPGGRNSRVMLARFPTLPPTVPIPLAPDTLTVGSWTIPYNGGPLPPLPQTTFLPSGTYTIDGNVRGSATVVITDNAANTAIQSIQVTYDHFSDNGRNVIKGSETVQAKTDADHPTVSCTFNHIPVGCLSFSEDLTLSGQRTGTKVTTPGPPGCTLAPPDAFGGFTLGAAVLLANLFQASGCMTTTIDGVTYTQPANGS
jgi:hypothetical protein